MLQCMMMVRFCSVHLFIFAGKPLELMETELLRHKVFEPVMLMGRDKYSQLDIRVRVKGGGHVAQAYAIRQALAKALVAYYQKCVQLVVTCFCSVLVGVAGGNCDMPYHVVAVQMSTRAARPRSRRHCYSMTALYWSQIHVAANQRSAPQLCRMCTGGWTQCTVQHS